MELKTYWLGLSGKERETFAAACETTSGHLRNISYGGRNCSAKLAVAIERESKGTVTCQELCPDIDWKFLRNSAVPRKNQGVGKSS